MAFPGSAGEERYQWSIRHGRWTSEQASQTRDALSQRVERACQSHFPASAGYETSKTSLSGMLSGTRVCVSRGEFLAVISTQQFTEPTARAPESRRHAIRLVGSIRRRGGERRGLQGSSALTLLFGAALLVALFYLSWVPGFLGVARLTLLMGFVIMMAPAIAWIVEGPSAFGVDALPMESQWRALPAARERDEHLARWREFLEAVNAEEVVSQCQNALPFRR